MNHTDPTLRVSVTTLEKFRRYMHEVSSYDTEESLIESIKGIFKGNDKTKVGGAFHKLIEGEYSRQQGRFVADEVSFTAEQAKVAFDYKKRHPLMIHEIPLRKTYYTNYFPIQVSARIDGSEGLNTHDTKTKFRSPDAQEYVNSIQWKFYLDMREADVFYYDLFEVVSFGFAIRPGNTVMQLNKDTTFIPHDPLQCIRYESMQHDVMQLLNSFLDYIHNRKFLHLLKPAIIEPELNF